MTPNNNPMKFPMHSFKILVGIVSFFALTTVATDEYVEAKETAPTQQKALQQDAFNQGSLVITQQVQNIKLENIVAIGRQSPCYLPPRLCNNRR